jgi:hypothetical protein
MKAGKTKGPPEGGLALELGSCLLGHPGVGIAVNDVLPQAFGK